MVLSRRQKAAFLLVGVILSVAIPVGLVGAEAFLSGFYQAGSGVTYKATSGPSIKLGSDVDFRSGNPFTANSVNISTNSSGTTVFSSSSSGASATVDAIAQPWTNLSVVDVSAARLTIEPLSAQNKITIGGGISAFRYKEITVGDGSTDIRYAATSTGNITIRGLSANTSYALADTSTDETIDVAESDSSGTVVFDRVDTNSLTAVSVRTQTIGETTGYYENSSTNVENGSYFNNRTNATLDNTINMLTRLGTYIVGTDSGETSMSGGATLLFGAIVWGAVLAMSSWSRTGMVGGGVLGTATVAGLVTAGLAPVWLWGVILFVLGLLAARPILRVVS